MNWETVIGLEVHAQLKTHSKLFSSSATSFGASPNSQTNYIDAGFPGTLPTLNKKAVELAIRFGLGIQANIQDLSYFERKNYFYPDLPKGYQISQFRRPILQGGYLDVEVSPEQVKRVHIDRAHLEEDAGKLIHEGTTKTTCIDLNRAGIGLLEIVTTPCLHSIKEVIAYLKTLKQLLQFLDVCDGNMQEGSFRCDVNLSLRPEGCSNLGTRTELKNLNSFRFIELAILYEQSRQRRLLEQGKHIDQETRSYCSKSRTTHCLRRKEVDTDYRYFPDPNLLPIHISSKDIQEIEHKRPPLPHVLKQQLKTDIQLTDKDVAFLLSDPYVYHYYTDVKRLCCASSKLIINWLKGPVQAILNERKQTFAQPPLSPVTLSKLLNALEKNSISRTNAKSIFLELISTQQDIDELLSNQPNHLQTHDEDEIEAKIQAMINQHPQQMAQYQAGNQKIIAFFIGKILKETQNQLDPKRVQYLLKKALNVKP